MSVRDSYRDYVLEQLGRVRPVTWKKMFGGVGIYADEVFFAVIDNDVLFFRTGEGNRAEFERRGMAPFQPMGPDTKPMAYHEVPGEVLENALELAAWVASSVEEARRAGARRPGKSPARAGAKGRKAKRSMA